MSISARATQVVSASATSRISAFVELTKPRISLLVLFSVAAAGFAASGESTSLWLIVSTVIGTGLIAASATIGNQIVELEIDRRMVRTAGRPLPSGRITSREATIMMLLTGIGGTALLAITVNFVAALIGIATWILYVQVYTPLKQRSSWNTLVGAIPGAMPVLIGWSATEAPIDYRCLCLFGILFLWQFPHFMAIAWLYRGDYKQGGLQMLTVTEPSGQHAGWLAISTALGLVGVSLLPILVIGLPSISAVVYLVCAIALGLWQFRLACSFLKDRQDHVARKLLRASLVYLPLLLFFFTFLPR